MADYTSEITQFLRQLKADRPELEADQTRGRRIWWDKEPLDLDQRRRDVRATVPQKAYPYQPATQQPTPPDHEPE